MSIQETKRDRVITMKRVFYLVADPETGLLLSFCNIKRVTGRYYRAARFLSSREAQEAFESVGLPENGRIVTCEEYHNLGFANTNTTRAPREGKAPEESYLLKKKQKFAFFTRTNQSRITRQPNHADVFLSQEEAYQAIAKYNLKGYEIQPHRQYLKRTTKGEGERNYLLQDKETKLFVSLCNIKSRTKDLKKAAFFGSPEEAAQVATDMGWRGLQVVSRNGDRDLAFPQNVRFPKSKHIDPTAYFVVYLESRNYPDENFFFGRSSQSLTTALVRNADIFSSYARAEKAISRYKLRDRFRTAVPITFAEASSSHPKKISRSFSNPSHEYILQDKQTTAFFTFATPARLTVSRVRAARFLSEQEKDDILAALQEQGWDVKAIASNEKPNPGIPRIKSTALRSPPELRSQYWAIQIQHEGGKYFFSRIKRGRRCTFAYEADVFAKQEEAQQVAIYYNLSHYEIVRILDVASYDTRNALQEKASSQKTEQQLEKEQPKEQKQQGETYVLQCPQTKMFYSTCELSRVTHSTGKAALFPSREEAQKYKERLFLKNMEAIPFSQCGTLDAEEDEPSERGYVLVSQEEGGHYYARSSLSRKERSLQRADRFEIVEDAQDELERAAQETGYTYEVIAEEELLAIFGKSRHNTVPVNA